MYPMTNDQREIRRKLRILEHAEATGRHCHVWTAPFAQGLI
jgi:hypothetical protein